MSDEEPEDEFAEVFGNCIRSRNVNESSSGDYYLVKGQTCAKLVKGIVARELGVSPAVLEPAGVPQTGMQIHCLRRLSITGQPENWVLHFTPGKKWWN